MFQNGFVKMSRAVEGDFTVTNASFLQKRGLGALDLTFVFLLYESRHDGASISKEKTNETNKISETIESSTI